MEITKVVKHFIRRGDPILLAIYCIYIYIYICNLLSQYGIVNFHNFLSNYFLFNSVLFLKFSHAILTLYYVDRVVKDS